jgi:hypothetical protein
MGAADSAAAAAVERLRRAEESAQRERERGSIVRRASVAIKRALILLLPHGLVVAWVSQRGEKENDR